MIKSKKTKRGDWVIAAVCFLVILTCVLPMVTLAARSLSDSRAVMRAEVTLWPKGFTLEAYRTILFDNPRYTRSLGWTAILTIICTLLSLFMTTICAYPLIYDKLKGRKFFNAIFIFTMYFGAGLVPNYVLYTQLDLIDNPLVLIIPNCLSVFNVIIMRSFLFGIPDSLRESAEIDGAGPIRILVSIYLPLSTSVIATLALFYAVGRWNGYGDALFFMSRNRDYYPIQYLLYNLIAGTQGIEASTIDLPPGTSDVYKAAAVMFATIPILLIYPWLQRYFIHGVTLGSEKG